MSSLSHEMHALQPSIARPLEHSYNRLGIVTKMSFDREGWRRLKSHSGWFVTRYLETLWSRRIQLAVRGDSSTGL
jgi:hypothetical protein